MYTSEAAHGGYSTDLTHIRQNVTMPGYLSNQRGLTPLTKVSFFEGFRNSSSILSKIVQIANIINCDENLGRNH